MTNAPDKFKIPINASIFLVSTMLAVFVFEFVSRIIFPISPGVKYLSPEGKPIKIKASPERFLPNVKARMVSQEFDAKVTTTSLGYRVPEARGNPEIIFIGDSFTYGSGLSDEETFAYRFCEKANLSCANLGYSGTGTIRQLNILERFLEEENWRPKHVKLFLLLMTRAFMAGNDFQDILEEERALRNKENPGAVSTPDKNSLEEILGFRKWVLARSNLARIGYYLFAPALREKLSPEPVETRKQAAYKIMRDQIKRFDEIANRYNFTYKIYVLHPMHDLTGDGNVETINTVQEIVDQAVPGTQVVETASAMLDDPLSYYYKFNGHFNPKGGAKIAETLWIEWQKEEKSIMQ